MLVFKCVIQGIVQSGLISFVLTANQYGELDKCMTRKMRPMLKGEGTKRIEMEDGIAKFESKGLMFLWRTFQIVDTETELRIQIISQIQKIMLQPESHEQFLTAMF